MASNSFGTIFRITTWGESHGPAIGVVIDGCPAGLAIEAADINRELAARAPGLSPFTSPRKETDCATILSGTLNGRTTGAPLSIMIPTTDARPQAYAATQHLLRPGHATFTYREKYGCFDYRGGGRASARETAARVAAGAVAKKLLALHEISVCAYIRAISLCSSPQPQQHSLAELADAVTASPVRCPDLTSSAAMMAAILEAKAAGDSLGGVVEAIAAPMPTGLGDPIYEKLEAKLAYAMLSIPASKGFEIGDGFAAACMRGSVHNDGFTCDASRVIRPSSNHAGGTLAGISTGLPLIFRVAFKPTSSIALPQATVDLDGNSAIYTAGPDGRHDPCVAIRGVAVVEAMTALVLADALLLRGRVGDAHHIIQKKVAR